MNLKPRLATILTNELPEYRDYINADGSLTLVLEKALYGLIELSLLWYEILSGFFKDRGFVKNPRDRCVLNVVYYSSPARILMASSGFYVSCATASRI